MLIYINTRSKKTRKQKAKQRAAFVAQQKKLGAPVKRVKQFITLALGERAHPQPAVIRPGGEDFKMIRSIDSLECDTFKRKTNKYTGDAMIGIATLHKSNAVPVFSTEDAKDISRMRRG